MKGKTLIEHDDGWTTVTKGPHGNKVSSHLSKATTVDNADPTQSQQRLDKLQDRYASFRTRFLYSQYWVQLQKTLDLQTDCHIDTAVCLGLGSLGSAQSTLVDRSLWQLVLFQEVCDYWQRRNNGRAIRRFAQDVAATDFDSAFLEQEGIALVEHPHGIERITDSTFLYDPFLPWAVMLCDVLPVISPAFYMGSTMAGIAEMCEEPTGAATTLKWEGVERSNEDFEKALPLAKTFLGNRSKVAMPVDFEHHSNAFMGMIMLVQG